MQDEIHTFRTEVMVRLAKLETKLELMESKDLDLVKDIEDLKEFTNKSLEKIDAKCTYIERDMPSASTYKFITIVVGVVLTAAVGIIVSALR